MPGTPRVMTETDASFEELLESLKRVAAALRGADVPFVLGGGVAIWARGGPETDGSTSLDRSSPFSSERRAG